MPHPSPLLEILLGTLPVLGTLFIHGAGMHLVQWRLRHHGALPKRSRLRAAYFALMIVLMLLTHLAEIALWAGTLNFLEAISSLRDAFYFVAVTYTTLGYGEATLPEAWRLMAPMIAISGLFAFGWTTSVLMNLVTQANAEPRTEARSRNGG
jgi:uncharacterized protein YhhL (DUF1145 family)